MYLVTLASLIASPTKKEAKSGAATGNSRQSTPVAITAKANLAPGDTVGMERQSISMPLKPLGTILVRKG